MAEPADMIVPLLKEMRSEIALLRTRVDDLGQRMDQRFDRLEEQVKAFEGRS